METALRLMNRVPWQVSATIGWAGLIIIPTALEINGRESASNAASHERVTPLHLGQERLDSLKSQGYIVVDDAIDERTLSKARAECDVLRSEGVFKKTDQHDARVRSDSITWIEETESLHGASQSWIGSVLDRTWFEDTETGGAHAFRDSALDPELPGLLAVLRRLRAQALQIEQSGFSGFEESASSPRPYVDLGVQRAGQLASYGAPSQARSAHTRASGCDMSTSTLSGNDGSGHKELDGEADEVVDATRGARYTPHRDGISFGGGSPFKSMLIPSVCMRELTCILYLTAPVAEWGGGQEAPRTVANAEECRGGSLILFLGADMADVSGSTATSIVEVLPVGGRLVIFDSRSVLHEVKPHQWRDVDRLAMTVWIGGAHSVAGFFRHCQDWWLGGGRSLFKHS